MPNFQGWSIWGLIVFIIVAVVVVWAILKVYPTLIAPFV